MARAASFVGAGAALLAAACQSAAPGSPARAPSAPAATQTAVYACEDGGTVIAAYQGERARLELAGRNYALATAVSGSGARYVGEGLQWWTKGLERARLSRLAPGETIAADPGVACSTTSTPITGVTPTAAAQVVARYYALLAAGRSRDAAPLRTDGVAPDAAPAALRVDVGAPGQPEGAAGSIYVEVPVTLQGPSGGARGGRVLLRRANDVPGASADQLRWRIERITLQPLP